MRERAGPVLAAERRARRRRPEYLILRVDRTDPSKNVVRGFRAFELYLDAHPEMHGRVGMLALLDPSRQDIPEYAEYLGAIQRGRARVNDRFQRDGWTPIDLRIEDNFPQAVAAYKQYDVLLVNAIFDGLNLVAKEAPLVNERDGVLVLSENAGAHEELGDWALTVNPFDVAGQAEAIHAALEMPRRGAPARGSRRSASTCARTTSAAWLEAQLARSRPLRRPGRQRERALSRRRVGRACAWSTSAASRSRGGARSRAAERAHGARDGAASARAAEGRRARDRAARRDHGGEADERADPALPPAAAHARRRRARGRRTASVEITASAETTAQTGVEMEALTAATVAALTVYDMAKAVDKEMSIDGRAPGREDEGAGVRAAVLTVSDGVAAGTREDASGDVLDELLAARATRSSGASCPTSGTRSPRRSRSSPPRRELVLTTGGTGLGPRDVTPEATATVLERDGARASPRRSAPTRSRRRRTRCSRAASPGCAARTLVVNLPGSPGGCRDGFAVLRPALEHALRLLPGEATAHRQT